MTKTIREWLQELPEPYNEMAIKNAERAPLFSINDKMDSASEALIYAFSWSRSNEGADFWQAIEDNCKCSELDASEEELSEELESYKPNKAQQLAQLINGEYDKFSDGSASWVQIETPEQVVSFSFDGSGEKLESISVYKRVFQEVDQIKTAEVKL